MSEAVTAYLPLVVEGTLVTVLVAMVSLAGAMGIGLMGAYFSIRGGRVSRAAVRTYTTAIRGIPDLVLMLLFYFGGQMLVNHIGRALGLWKYVEISAFGAGTLTIAIIFGAYMIETFRGAALAIPKGLIEAGLAYALPPRRMFTRIIWPQLMAYALPGIANNWQVLMKTTALVSVIGLQDMVFNSFQAGRTTRQMFVFMALTMAIYLLITMVSAVVFHMLGRRQAKSGIAP